DFIVEGLDRSKSAMIVTSNADEVCARLSEEFGCGLTIMDARGFYSQAQKQVVYIVINRFQITRMKNIVHTTDPLAYITISEIADVFMREQ
ncbi:MAG: YitT family protein, partial [Clostridia bacterium]|nr:YitT family protein [Clostridia bacterium]